jgi:hypothetical protein
MTKDKFFLSAVVAVAVLLSSPVMAENALPTSGLISVSSSAQPSFNSTPSSPPTTYYYKQPVVKKPVVKPPKTKTTR